MSKQLNLRIAKRRQIARAERVAHEMGEEAMASIEMVRRKIEEAMSTNEDAVRLCH